MNPLSTMRYLTLVSAGMLAAAFFSTTSLHAQTNAPATPPAPAPGAPATTSDAKEIDKETGKPIVTTPSGLKYIDLAPGTGPDVKTGDHVAVKYVGKLTDGTTFDSTDAHGGAPLEYVQGVDQLIAGWTEGVSTMKVGGKRKLIIPPQLGYGLQGMGDAVPPNATLIFTIELVSAKSS